MDFGILYHSLLSTTQPLQSLKWETFYYVATSSFHRNQSGPALLLHSGHYCWVLYPLPMRAERLRPPLASRTL